MDSLQFQLMILQLQFQNLFLIYDQSGNDGVDKKCSGIGKKTVWAKNQPLEPDGLKKAVFADKIGLCEYFYEYIQIDYSKGKDWV